MARQLRPSHTCFEPRARQASIFAHRPRSPRQLETVKAPFREGNECLIWPNQTWIRSQVEEPFPKP